MFCGTVSIPRNISLIQIECGEYLRIFYGILSFPKNIMMDMNYVMRVVSGYQKLVF